MGGGEKDEACKSGAVGLYGLACSTTASCLRAMAGSWSPDTPITEARLRLAAAEGYSQLCIYSVTHIGSH